MKIPGISGEEEVQKGGPLIPSQDAKERSSVPQSKHWQSLTPRPTQNGEWRLKGEGKKAESRDLYTEISKDSLLAPLKGRGLSSGNVAFLP